MGNYHRMRFSFESRNALLTFLNKTGADLRTLPKKKREMV
jgi:hypothetical protein